MLVTLKEIMEIAEERKIAVGAFNALGIETLRAITDAAEALRVPVILQHAQCHEELVPLDIIAPVMLQFARRASVPVCVHLDHGETLEYVARAIDLGFTSVMYDGSTLPYAENLANTRETVAMAHPKGVSVEAELGSMGRKESGSGDGGPDETKIYTDPAQAKQFVADTGIDALACSFGTTHGIYLKKPVLDFSVVERVREGTGGIPVVMHGGSGVSREEFHRAVEAGVRKINYFTYMDKAGGAAAAAAAGSSPVFFSQISTAARHAMEENVRTAMATFARLDGDEAGGRAE